jgi:FkbM family methyltransferase
VPYPYLSKALSRIRAKLGTEGLGERLDGLEGGLARLDVLEEQLADIANSPKGPVYLGDHTALVETRWGGILIVDTRESVLAPALLLLGMWEPAVTEWFQSVLSAGRTFVDIGANIGYYSLLASRLTGTSGRVIAIEAHPRMVELLRRNMVVNGFGGVSIRHAAAWSEAGTVKFNLRSHFAANSSVGALAPDQLHELGDTEQIVEVEAIAVDDLLDSVRTVDFLKVDVEGAEVRAFSGLSRTLHRSPDVTVMFEWSPGQLRMVGDDPEALLDLLEGHGLRFRLVEAGMKSVDRDGLLGIHHANVVAAR